MIVLALARDHGKFGGRYSLLSFVIKCPKATEEGYRLIGKTLVGPLEPAEAEHLGFPHLDPGECLDVKLEVTR